MNIDIYMFKILYYQAIIRSMDLGIISQIPVAWNKTWFWVWRYFGLVFVIDIWIGKIIILSSTIFFKLIIVILLIIIIILFVIIIIIFVIFIIIFV